MNRLHSQRRATILRLLVEGSSRRSISRVTGTAVNTIIKLHAAAGRACMAIHDEAVRNVPSKRIQVDEAWSFACAKQKNVGLATAAPDRAGDVWTWTAPTPTPTRS